MSLEEFLNNTNGIGRNKCKTRIFDENDYKEFIEAYNEAIIAKKNNQFFIKEKNAGNVPNSYKYSATTARWGIYIDPQNRNIMHITDRITIWSRYVPPIYPGSTRKYLADTKNKNIP